MVNLKHKEYLVRIGKQIRKLRKQKKVSIIKMSEDIGISRNAISQLEHGKVYFKISALLKILDYLEYPYLLFFINLYAESIGGAEK